MLAQKDQQEGNCGNAEGEQDGQIPVAAQSFIDKDGNKSSGGNDQSCHGKQHGRSVGGKAKIFGKKGGQPEYHTGAYDAGQCGDRCELDDLPLQQQLQAATGGCLCGLKPAIPDVPPFFKDGKEEETEKTKALVNAILSDEVRDYINENYQGAVVPVF